MHTQKHIHKHINNHIYNRFFLIQLNELISFYIYISLYLVTVYDIISMQLCNVFSISNVVQNMYFFYSIICLLLINTYRDVSVEMN